MKKTLLTIALSSVAFLSLNAHADNESFWSDSNGVVVTDGQGNCLRTIHWQEKDGNCPRPENLKVEIKPAPIPIKIENQQAEVESYKETTNTIRFSLNSYLINKNNLIVLDKIAEDIKANKKVKTIKIEGHTDTTGSKFYNQTLSEKRAETVKKYLASKGVDASKMQTIGFGFEKPVASNKTKDGRAENRRVDVKY
jgi:OOP family OmpA-OmpF porin